MPTLYARGVFSARCEVSSNQIKDENFLENIDNMCAWSFGLGSFDSEYYQELKAYDDYFIGNFNAKLEGRIVYLEFKGIIKIPTTEMLFQEVFTPIIKKEQKFKLRGASCSIYRFSIQEFSSDLVFSKTKPK